MPGVTPTKGLRPLGIAFIVIVSFIWPIYYYVRSSFRSFRDGLISQLPFKFAGFLLLTFAISLASGHTIYSGRLNCPAYVKAEFKFFSLAVFGYFVVMLLLRSIRAKDFLDTAIRRENWPRPILYLDGILAIGVEIITAPWILEGFRELFQLPESSVINWGIRVSDSIVTTTIGHFVSTDFGAGKSFLESGSESINKVFTGHLGSTFCLGGSYQGGWLLALGFAVLLLPATVVVSFEPLLFIGYSPKGPKLRNTYNAPYEQYEERKKCGECEGDGVYGLDKPLLVGAQCPVCCGSGFESHKERDNPFSLMYQAWVVGVGLFISWLVLDFIFFIIRLATGV